MTTETPLTRREIEVVRHLCEGAKESAVARRMGISSATVHSHVASAHRKLNVTSRARLITVVLALGIIPIEEVRASICVCNRREDGLVVTTK